MPKEIERKFLVNTTLLPTLLGEGGHIFQGYLSHEPVVRVRTINHVDLDRANVGPTMKGYLTVKGPGLLERDEFEYEIPVDDAKQQLRLCKDTVSKVRYDIMVGPWKYELDRFLAFNAGLYLAEIELPTRDTEFERPTWLGLEVTEDKSYANVELARNKGERKFY